MATDIDASTAHPPADHDWRGAGEAWGRRAADWSCLFEHYATDVTSAVFDATGVGPGVELLDIACGAGLAIRRAEARGATTAGLDASAALLEVARTRNPDSDLRRGSMFDLPWGDAQFDVVTSINGIWGHCGPALVEAHRVLVPGGLLGFSYWGSGPPLDLRPVFQAIAVHVRHATIDGMRRTNQIARDGVAEQMATDAGLAVVHRGRVTSVIEWPDVELAWRAIASMGPVAPALAATDHGRLRADVARAIERCRDSDGIYRLRNDHRYVIAQRPH